MLKRSLHLLSAVAVAIMLSGFVGVGQAAASTAVKAPEGAKVSVVVVAKPVADPNILPYEIIAANHTGTYARNVTITVPFNAAALKIADVKFSGGPAWVQTNDANALVYRIEGLHENHPVTAAVRFAKIPNAPTVAALTEPATFSWTVEGRKDTGKSNMPMAFQPNYALGVTSFETPDGTTQRLASNLFVPNEPVTFWCNMPNGDVHALMIHNNGSNVVLMHTITTHEKRTHDYTESLRTDPNGAMTIDFPAEELSPGPYSIIAHGEWSGLQAVAPFEMK